MRGLQTLVFKISIAIEACDVDAHPAITWLAFVDKMCLNLILKFFQWLSDSTLAGFSPQMRVSSVSEVQV